MYKGVFKQGGSDDDTVDKDNRPRTLGWVRGIHMAVCHPPVALLLTSEDHQLLYFLAVEHSELERKYAPT